MKGHPLSATRSADDGFTLVELVVAMSILLISLIGVVTAVSFAAQASSSTDMRTKAINLANERIERARNLAYDDVGVQYADGTFGPVPGTILSPETVNGLTVSTQVTWARDPVTHRAKYKDVRVDISWSVPSTGTISVTSSVFGKSMLVNTGDLEVNVLDKTTNLPIVGATVVVDPSTVGAATRTSLTGNDGKAFYGYIESGAASITITAAGYVFDPTELSAPSVTPDLFTSITVWGQRPSTLNLTVIDASSTPIPGATCVIDGVKTAPLTLVTNASGVASFTGLIIDTYDVAVSYAGNVPFAGSNAITTSGQTVGRTVRLAAPPIPGALSIVVQSISGMPLSGASVQLIGPAPATTAAPGSPRTSGSTGEAVFNGLDPGDYTVNVTRTSYYASLGTVVTVLSSVQNSRTIQLTPTATTGTLGVYVVDSGGHPKKNVNVTVVYGSGPTTVSTKKTNNSGYAEWAGLTVRQYVAYLTSTPTVRATAQVVGGETSIVTLTQ